MRTVAPGLGVDPKNVNSGGPPNGWVAEEPETAATIPAAAAPPPTIQAVFALRDFAGAGSCRRHDPRGAEAGRHRGHRRAPPPARGRRSAPPLPATRGHRRTPPRPRPREPRAAPSPPSRASATPSRCGIRSRSSGLMGRGRTPDHTPPSTLMRTAYHPPAALSRNCTSALAACSGGTAVAETRAYRPLGTQGTASCRIWKLAALEAAREEGEDHRQHGSHHPPPGTA